MRYVLIIVLLALLLGPLAANPSTASASGCQFALGFKTLHDLVPSAVGECLADEHVNPQTGDSVQETTRGILVWRKTDNITAFTDGYRTWLLGPSGLQTRLNSDRFAWEDGGSGKCEFVLGFKALRDRIPSVVGDCTENEHLNPDDGNVQQRTTKGLLVWRGSDNFTVFTDGYRTWLVGPNGLQNRLNTTRFPWEKDNLNLRITSAGFGQSGNAVGLAAVVENPNSGLAMEDTGLLFTAYDAAGAPLATQNGIIRLVLPTEKRAVASQMQVPSGLKVARVTAKLQQGKLANATRTSLFGIENVGFQGGPTRVVGTITNPFAFGMTNIYVSAVAYDAGGNIVGGGGITITGVAANSKTAVGVPIVTPVTPARVGLFASITSATR